MKIESGTNLDRQIAFGDDGYNINEMYQDKESIHLNNTTPVRRNSSIELLRIVLMLLIVVHHGIVHGLGLTALSPKFNSVLLFNPENSPIILLVNALCIVGVNCFILISGYYGIRFSKKKLWYLISILLFYSIVFNVIPAVIHHNYHEAIKSLLFLSNSPYWFVIDYLFLLFFAPMLNMMFKSMNRRYIISLIIVMTIMSIYFGFIWQHKVNENGYQFFQFIYLYCLGKFLRKYRLSTPRAILLYITCSILTALGMFALIKGGFSFLAWRMTYYNNPLIILSAIGLFYVFHNMSFYCKAINYIAKSALAIYLVQSSVFVSKWYYNTIANFAVSGNYSIWDILLNIIILSTVLVAFSLLIDMVRRLLIHIISQLRHAKS